MKQIAVIGAGGSGLCAAKHLLGSNLQPVIFEQSQYVGGQWVHQPVNQLKQNDVFSSIYDSLRTNQPRQVMEFPDFKFPEHLPSFIHHTDVRNYLESYTEEFNLRKVINFETKVEKISPNLNQNIECSNSEFVRWNVVTSCKERKTTETYDGVVVCNGHYTFPAYPTIKGIENYKGEILHSHFYRNPDPFSNQTVLILGNGPSGSDIMLELAKTCKRVYYSHRAGKTLAPLPSNVIEVSNINRVNTDGHFIFDNNETSNPDIFIPCTGYTYTFPFLDNTCGIDITPRVLKNVYKHLFNIQYPSMCIVGVPWTIAPFPLIHQQCAYMTSIYTAAKSLPSFEDMVKDTENDFTERQSRGEPFRYYHRLFLEQFNYNNNLADLSGYPRNPPVMEKIYRRNMLERDKNLIGYKNGEYKTFNDCDFELSQK